MWILTSINPRQQEKTPQKRQTRKILAKGLLGVDFVGDNWER
jgi:hypothetical protein